jgi:hypothetical protein
MLSVRENIKYKFCIANAKEFRKLTDHQTYIKVLSLSPVTFSFVIAISVASNKYAHILHAVSLVCISFWQKYLTSALRA